MQSPQSIIEYQTDLIMLAIIKTQDEHQISDEDMSAVFENIQDFIQFARRSVLS